jgi:hypothetical protein
VVGRGLSHRLALKLHQAHLSPLVINHDIVRLDISVHDPTRVTKVEGFEELVDIVAHVEIGEFGVESLEVGVVDVFKDD